MTQNELIRLIEWLRDHGFSTDDIVDCLEYIESGRKNKK